MSSLICTPAARRAALPISVGAHRSKPCGTRMVAGALQQTWFTFGVQGLGLRVEGLWFRVQGAGVGNGTGRAPPLGGPLRTTLRCAENACWTSSGAQGTCAPLCRCPGCHRSSASSRGCPARGVALQARPFRCRGSAWFRVWGSHLRMNAPQPARTVRRGRDKHGEVIAQRSKHLPRSASGSATASASGVEGSGVMGWSQHSRGSGVSVLLLVPATSSGTVLGGGIRGRMRSRGCTDPPPAPRCVTPATSRSTCGTILGFLTRLSST